jgi:Gas vesicle protein G
MLLQLLTAPISLPLAGFRFVLGQIQEMAERELYDEDLIRDDLLLLQLQLEEGEIDEASYQEREAEIMQRMRVARAYREGAGSAPAGNDR